MPRTHQITRRQLIQAGATVAGAFAGGSLIGVSSIELVAAADATPGAETRGTLIIRGGNSNFPATFNPLLNDARIWIYDGLVRFDKDLNPIPDLAESWTISADGLVYTFKLRQNVTFHDGTPMTADDVVFTAQLTLDEKINSPYRDKFIIDGKPVAWAKVDDYTVTATLPSPSGSFLAKCSRADEIFFCILPKHLLENVTDMTTAPFNQNPVGTGPFKFVSYDQDQQVVTAAHDDYHQGKPGLAQVVRLKYDAEQTALAALQAHDIDASSLSEAGNVATAKTDSSLKVYSYFSNWIFAARYNFLNPILADINVRQAINYAIDRDNLCKAAVSPDAEVGNSPISVGWAASPNVTVFNYDPDKAKSILDAAGWTGSGIRQKDGKKLSLTLSIYPSYGAPDLAAGMQQLLQQVGIDMQIKQLELATFNTQVYTNRDYDFYLDWQGFGVDPDIASRWTTATATTGSYVDNPSGYTNPQVDIELAAATVALTQKDRQAHLWKAQDLITADAPCLWLDLFEALVAIGPGVAGFNLPGTTADMDNTGFFMEPWKLTSERK